MSSKSLRLEISKKVEELRKLKELRLAKIGEYELEEDLGFRHSSYAIELEIQDIESDITYVEMDIADLKSLLETEILCEEEEAEFENHLDKKVKKY